MRFGFFDGNKPVLFIAVVLVSLAAIGAGWTWDGTHALQFGW